jgi:hypothetical protein
LGGLIGLGSWGEPDAPCPLGKGLGTQVLSYATSAIAASVASCVVMGCPAGFTSVCYCMTSGVSIAERIRADVR